MLSIQIVWSKEKFELNVVGHAGYAEHGKDIVCAAVSVIVDRRKQRKRKAC